MRYLKANFNKFKSNALSDKDLKRVLGPVPIIKYPKIHDLINIDQVFNPEGHAIILYLTENEYTGHWLCLIRRNNTIEFYNSYGSHPDNMLQTLNAPEELNGDPKRLSQLIENSGYDLVYNNKKRQQKKEDINTCGKHIALRLLLSHLSLDEYNKLLDSLKIPSDDIVTGISYSIIKK